MKIVHNKLVRDYIPRIIRKDNKKCKTRVLEEDEYKKALFDKLSEEVAEVKNASTRLELAKELADVLEVIEAIERIYEISDIEVGIIKETKADENGKFDKKLFLEYVIEDDSCE